MVGNNPELRKTLLSYFHTSPTGGHSGVNATMKRLTVLCIGRALKEKFGSMWGSALYVKPASMITRHIQDYYSFFHCRKIYGQTFLLILLRAFLSKYEHFITLAHPFSTVSVAQAFLDNLYKLVGVPCSIVFDWDKVFLSTF